MFPWSLLFFGNAFRNPFSLRAQGRRRIKSSPISLLPLLDENRYKNVEGRPVIYSFYEHKDGDILSSIENKLGKETMLRVWAELWAEAGWNPTLLTIGEARKNPDFTKYEDLLKKSGMKNYHWLFGYLAMCTVGGGWFAKLNVLPIHFRTTQTSGPGEIADEFLPNGGGFTTQDTTNPTSLLSGNEKEWSRIVRTLVENVKHDEISSMEFLLQYKSYHVEDTILQSDELSKIEFGPNLCKNTKERRAVRCFLESGRVDYAVLTWINARKSRCQPEVYSDKSFVSSLHQNIQPFTDSKHVPLVMIIGAQKAATSLIFQMLERHPMIAYDTLKEKHYFVTLTNRLTRQSYQQLFPKPDGFHLAIDATPEYIMWTNVLPRIQEICSWPKIIVSLRNPVDRLFSQYNIGLHEKTVQGSFEEFIERDMKLMRKVGLLPREKKVANSNEAWKRLLEEVKVPTGLTVAKGLYSLQLREWFSHFPRESFLILNFDDLQANPKIMHDKVISFLGLPKNNIGHDLVWNEEDDDGARAMTTATRKMLYDLYKPFNEELSSMLGKEWDRVWQLQDK